MAVPAQGATPANTYLTTGGSAATNIREDLADIIYRIDPDEVPLLSSMSVVEADAVKTEWLVQELAAADKNAQPEGFTFATQAPVRPVRADNICQIAFRAVTVSNTLRAVNTVGGDEFSRQSVLKGMEVKRDVEYALTRPTPKKATDPREMAGVPIWCTNGSVGAAGVLPPGDGTAGTFAPGTARDVTLAMIAAAVQQAYEDGGKPRQAIVSPTMKKTFSGLASGGAGNAVAMDNILQATAPKPATFVGAVDVYLTDFGSLQVTPDRFAPNGQFLIIDPDWLELAPLPGRNMIEEEYAKVGDNVSGGVIWEGTVRATAPKAHACIFGLN